MLPKLRVDLRLKRHWREDPLPTVSPVMALILDHSILPLHPPPPSLPIPLNSEQGLYSNPVPDLLRCTRHDCKDTDPGRVRARHNLYPIVKLYSTIYNKMAIRLEMIGTASRGFSVCSGAGHMLAMACPQPHFLQKILRVRLSGLCW